VRAKVRSQASATHSEHLARSPTSHHSSSYNSASVAIPSTRFSDTLCRCHGCPVTQVVGHPSASRDPSHLSLFRLMKSAFFSSPSPNYQYVVFCCNKPGASEAAVGRRHMLHNVRKSVTAFYEQAVRRRPRNYSSGKSRDQRHRSESMVDQSVLEQQRVPTL